MSETEIPADVKATVAALIGFPDKIGYAKVFAADFAEAILAERERCAKIAERGVPTDHPQVFDIEPSVVAAAIRKGA